MLDIFRHCAIIWLPLITVLIACLTGIHRQYTTNLIQPVVSPSLFLSSKWLIICEGSVSGFFIWRCMHKDSGMFFYIIYFWEDIASSCMISEMIFWSGTKKPIYNLPWNVENKSECSLGRYVSKRTWNRWVALSVFSSYVISLCLANEN